VQLAEAIEPKQQAPELVFPTEQPLDRIEPLVEDGGSKSGLRPRFGVLRPREFGLIKGLTGSNLLLQEDCEFGRGGCSPIQILLTQGAVQAD